MPTQILIKKKKIMNIKLTWHVSSFFLFSIVISKGPDTQKKKKIKSLTPLHSTNTAQETRFAKFLDSYHDPESSRQSAFSKAIPIFWYGQG